MIKKLAVAIVVLFLWVSAQLDFAAEKGDASAEFKVLEARIRTKLREGRTTEKDLAPELKEFETLLDGHQGEKTEAVADILLMQAKLYLQVFDNTEKATELVTRLQSDFSQTPQGQNAYRMLAAIRKQEEAKKIQASLVPGAEFPDFFEQDLAGNPLSLANYKGKVVLVEYWATWHGPFVQDLPSLMKIYDKYHSFGFEIIGVSLDHDQQKLMQFLKEKKMTWQQFFDGQGWENKLAVRCGVHRLPAAYLLNSEGKIIGKNLHGEALAAALAQALPGAHPAR